MRRTLHLVSARPTICPLFFSEKTTVTNQPKLEKWKEQVNTEEIEKSSEALSGQGQARNFFLINVIDQVGCRKYEGANLKYI